MMRKHKFLNVLILTLLFLRLFSQNNISGDVSQSKQVVKLPATAESYSISKVEKLPMDYFRGRANISIPIYNINLGSVNVPISLSYNTGGIKLNEVSSIVGLGWSLNIPGNIQHNVIGLNDFYAQMFSKNINDYSNFNGRINYYTPNYEQLRQSLTAISENNYDTKPDLFDYNLPDVSGSFILKNNGDVFTIPNEDTKINRINNKFNIVSNNGVKYWLSGRGFVMSEYIGGSNGNVTYYSLDSLKVNNNRIVFEYLKSNSYTEKNIQEKANFKLTPNIGGSYENLDPLIPYEKTISTTSNIDNLITKIIFDEGEIYFQYSNDLNMAFSDGTNYRKDINGGNGIALRRIYVKNRSGKIVRDISLNYDYFESSNTVKTYEDYRLKLIGVHNNLDDTNYKFSYNEEYKLPKRNTSNSDYWGYINSIGFSENDSNIPSKISSVETIADSELQKVVRRDREPNITFAQLGSLKTIEYPTGGSKNFFYELPLVSVKKSAFINARKAVDSVKSGYSGSALETGYTSKNFSITSQDFIDIANEGGTMPRIEWHFTNTCENSNETEDYAHIYPSNCTGTINIGPNHYSSNGRPFMGDAPLNGTTSGSLSLFRDQPCQCEAGVDIIYKKQIYFDEPASYSGLRIKRIEDINENNVTNSFDYKYGYYNQSNDFVNISNLKQPYNFSSETKRYLRIFIDGVESYQAEPYFEKFLTVHNSSQSDNSYGSSEIATYPYVIEKNGKGEIIMEYEDIADNSGLTYNKWKLGKLKKEIILDYKRDTLRITKHNYNFNYIKNGLSGYTTSSVPENVAFAFDLNILRSKMQISSSTTNMEADIFFVDKKMNFIESAKDEKLSDEVTEFINGNKVLTKTSYNYYDNDIDKPINLRNNNILYPDSTTQETTYQYAHEKGNQYLIDKNMVGIPLQTTVTKNNIGISSIETKYPTSQTEATSKTNGLPLPTSVLSYGLQIPGTSSSSKTELIYDQYDSKGNILQYTEKGLKPTVIIWGYNQTQPIAKIEGISYNSLMALSGVSTLVNDAITASGADVDATTEQSLITALDNLRSNSSLSNYQITTYTYDPLIGVTSITPPSGIREIYKYDTANRLQSVVDINGKILKEYQYNYKQ